MGGVLAGALSLALPVVTSAGAVPVALVCAAAGVLLVMGRRAAERRHREHAAWAEPRGWVHTREDAGLVDRWRGQPFGEGSARRATEVLRGTLDGFGATSFTYCWTTGTGESAQVHRRHVVAIDLPAALPLLELTPEGVSSRIARAFGGQDITFESDAFNRAWRVQAADLRFAHDVLHPRVMERLLLPDVSCTSLRIDGSSLLCWDEGTTDLVRLERRLVLLVALVRAVPRHVWQDRGCAVPG